MNGKQLKNSILQWAIQGKLVPQDPNDEPASVLLERIREEKARLVKEKKIKKDKNESIIFRGDDNSHYEKFADGTVKCIDDEIPFEIPQSWCWERWGNISFSIQYGFNAPAIESGDIKMVRISDIHDNKVNWQDVPYCKISQSEIGTYLLQENDILFARTGGTVGKSFLMGTVSEPAIYAGYLIRTRYSKELCPQYLKSFMESSLYWEQLRSGTIATAQPNCNGKTLGRMLLPIPPKNEQNRIISKLQTIESSLDKYTLAQEALDTLNADIFDKLKKSVLQEAIQGRLVPQDPNDEPASKLLERIKVEKAKLFKEGKLKKKDLVDSVIFKGEDNKYYETIDGKTECIDERIPFELPHNWCWATLGNLVQNCSGLAYKKENLDERSTSYIRVLRGGNIDDGQWTMKDDDVMIASKFVKPELLLTAGTFITPAVTSIEQMGKTALVRDDQPQTVVGGFVLMLLPFLRDWSLLDYLELIFQSEYYKGYCRSITNKSGQAFYNLSRQKLMQFLVPLPPLNERIAIANEVAKINSMMR